MIEYSAKLIGNEKIINEEKHAEIIKIKTFSMCRFFTMNHTEDDITTNSILKA